MHNLPSTSGFLDNPGFKAFADLDGTFAAEFLRRAGCTDVRNADLGTNGLAVGKLPSGQHVALSTNGYFNAEFRPGPRAKAAGLFA